MLVSDLITYALRKLRVLAPDESPTATELADAFIALNLMMEDWSVEALAVFQRKRSVCSLVAGQQAYTVGTGGNWATDAVDSSAITRPALLERAGCILDYSIANPLEVPMEVLNHQDEYASVVNKNLAATYPRKIWYNPTYPTGTAYLWPVPSGTSARVVLYYLAQISQFTATNQTVSLPPGYSTAIIFNLATRLAEDYGVTVTQNVSDQAISSLARVKKINTRLNIALLTTDYPSMERGRFNIILGDWKA